LDPSCSRSSPPLSISLPSPSVAGRHHHPPLSQDNPSPDLPSPSLSIVPSPTTHHRHQPSFSFLLNQLAKTKRGRSHTPLLSPLAGSFSFFSITDRTRSPLSFDHPPAAAEHSNSPHSLRHLLQPVSSSPSPAAAPTDLRSPSSAAGAISSSPSDRTTTHISTAASAATDDSPTAGSITCRRKITEPREREKPEESRSKKGEEEPKLCLRFFFFCR